MTSQRVERTWIRTRGYGRFRGEWVNVINPTTALLPCAPLGLAHLSVFFFFYDVCNRLQQSENILLKYMKNVKNGEKQQEY